MLTPSEQARQDRARQVRAMFATLYPSKCNKTTAYDIIAKRLRLSTRTVWSYLRQSNLI